MFQLVNISAVHMLVHTILVDWYLMCILEIQKINSVVQTEEKLLNYSMLMLKIVPIVQITSTDII